MTTGSCLCGGVRYALSGAFTDATNCHCTMCRKMHGAAYATYGEVHRDAFAWTAGEDRVTSFVSSPGVERSFCTTCGSTLKFVFDLEPDRCYVTLGTIDGDPGIRPVSHIFVGSKAPWHEITDALPQYETWTDDFVPK